MHWFWRAAIAVDVGWRTHNVDVPQLQRTA